MSTELVQVLQEFSLAEEKKNVVNGLLQPFFAKAEEWKTQVESIVITDPTQTDKMALAKTGRLQLKNFRLEAEKLIKAQREIVKTRMADDVLEDKLWLRSGQIMEAVFKNLETKLEEKEKFAERWEAEQEEIRRQERLSILGQYDVVEMPGLGKMSEEQFQTYLSGLKAQYEAKLKEEQERQEAERIQNLHNERYSRLSRYADFIPELDEMKLGELSEDDFIAIGTKAKSDKDAYDAEQARIKSENERLQKEKEEADERARIALAKALEEKEKAEREAQAEADRLKAEADAKLKAEQEARAKAEAEALRKQKEAEAEAERLRHAEQARIDAEKQAEVERLAEQERIAHQGENQRLMAWIESFELPSLPSGEYNEISMNKAESIYAKFKSFKVWAKTQIEE